MISTQQIISAAFLYAATQATVLYAHGDHDDHGHDHDHGHHHQVLIREGHAGINLGYSEDKGLHFFVGVDGHDHGHGGHGAPVAPLHDHDHDHLEPGHAVFVVGGFGAVTIAQDDAVLSQFAPSGSTVFLISQRRQHHVPFLGIEAEELSTEQFTGNVSIGLDHFHTPENGRLVMFTLNALNEVTVFWDTAAETQNVYTLPVGAHRHMFWLFTAPGEYKIELEAEVMTVGGETLEAKAEFKFAIGGKYGFWKHFEKEAHEGWYHTDLGTVYAAQWPWFFRENDTWYFAYGTGGAQQLYWRWSHDDQGNWIVVDPAVLPQFWKLTSF